MALCNLSKEFKTMNEEIRDENKIFDTVEEAIEAVKQGKMVIIADDEGRENEGDIICAADKITPEITNFMASKCRGLTCLAITSEKADQLGLSEMVSHNTDVKGTAFTQSVDADPKYGVTTGISAYDRAKTIEVVVARDSQPSDLRRPGHIFPLIAKKGGVLKRAGHTEASVDLARMAGLSPAGVLCEIMNDDGKMARRDDLKIFADKHGLKFITVAQLIKYRIATEKFITREAIANLPTIFGDFRIYGYKDHLSGTEHIALVREDDTDRLPLIRMHSECLTGDIFHSLRCDCNSQLHSALEMINEYGKGALVYLRGHEGRGIGLVNKIKAYALQEQGQDTIEANISLGFPSDLRDYGIGAQILRDLGYTEFKLITNNPKKIVGLEGYGLEVADRVQVKSCVTPQNEKYLHTKKERMHHLLGNEVH